MECSKGEQQMPTVSVRRTASLLVLLLAMILAPTWAASSSGPQVETPKSAYATEELSTFERAQRVLHSLWVKVGCQVYPWGRCPSLPADNPPIQRKEGCHIDPWGRCIP